MIVFALSDMLAAIVCLRTLPSRCGSQPSACDATLSHAILYL